MPHEKKHPATGSKSKMPPHCLRSLLKTIGNLSRTGMEAGNNGDFDKAFSNLEDALFLSRDLNKTCLEAKLLNNTGVLHTMNGAWDMALLAYERSMQIVSDRYGTRNVLYRTLQKNISYLLEPHDTVV
jgi:tetratricopeptide (TPR) repeat protein